MSNKFFNHLLLMLLAIPTLTLSSCNFNLFGGMHSSSEGPSSESDSKESSESESIESIESINEVTITFHANWNYGEEVEGEPAPKILTVASGTYITDDMLPVADERTGYAFKSWCTTPAGTRTFDWSKAIEKDYDVYASWIDLSNIDKIGLVGTINGWDPINDDYLLTSTDGIHYVIEDVLLKAGDIWKVVKNNSWDGQITGNNLNKTPGEEYYKVPTDGFDAGNIQMLKSGIFDITVDLSVTKSLSFVKVGDFVDSNPIVEYEVYLAGSFTTPSWVADESTKFTGSNGTYILTDYVFPAGEFKLNVFPVFQDGTKGDVAWLGTEVVSELPEGWTNNGGNIATVAGTYTLTYTIPKGKLADQGVLTIVETQESYTEGLIIENGVVIGYEGIDNKIIIPSEYEGVPVTSIGDYAFYGCTSLASIIIPDSVTSIGDSAFCECSSLTSINIPNSVILIGNGAFTSCTSLTSIVIPDSIIIIGNCAFSNCTSLTSINIPNSVTSIGNGAFQLCSSLTSINVDSKNIYYTSIDGILYSNDATTLICYPGGKVGEAIIPNSVTSIGNGAFSFCSYLTSINIPNNVTSIGDSAFYCCTSLISIIIPNSVTSIGVGAFADCSSLTIYCEAESQPSGWDTDWNPDNRPVEWGVNLIKYEIKYDTINVDAGGDALALINDPSIKLHTPDGWLFLGWRLYLACDSQGRVTYCVSYPNAGYGNPTYNTYLYHDFYKDPNNVNPSIELLDGFGPWVSGGDAHNQYNINIPEGGFGLVAHGIKAKEILIAITGGYITEEIVDSDDQNFINNNSNPCNAILTVVGDKIIITN